MNQHQNTRSNFSGQRMASELSQNNPDLIESLRRNMPRPPGTDPNNPAGSSNQPKPGGYIISYIGLPMREISFLFSSICF